MISEGIAYYELRQNPILGNYKFLESIAWISSDWLLCRTSKEQEFFATVKERYDMQFTPREVNASTDFVSPRSYPLPLFLAVRLAV